MKKILKLATLTIAAAIFALLPGSNVLCAQAAPTNYYVRYDGTKNEWLMQIGKWDENAGGASVFLLTNGDDHIKDGDTLAIMSGDVDAPANAPLSVNVRLGNLTIQNASAVVFTCGVDECYILGNSVAAVNGDVTNAYVYNNSTCTFNNNVTNLHLITTETDRPYTSVTVAGTVAYESEENAERVFNEYYNFPAGKYVFDRDLGVTTDPVFYSKTGPAPAAQPAEAAPAAPSAPAASASGEYDEVPKTGDSNLVFLLLAVSALCLAGRFALKKSARYTR